MIKDEIISKKEQRETKNTLLAYFLYSIIFTDTIISSVQTYK